MTAKQPQPRPSAPKADPSPTAAPRGNVVHVHANADGAFPELTRHDQIRGLLTAVGGVRRLNGPPAALLVGRTRHGRPIALEVNLATLAVAVFELAVAHGIVDIPNAADVVRPPAMGDKPA